MLAEPRQPPLPIAFAVQHHDLKPVYREVGARETTVNRVVLFDQCTWPLRDDVIPDQAQKSRVVTNSERVE